MSQNMMKFFLLFAGVFLIPVALTYGLDPAATLPKFMNVTVEGGTDPRTSSEPLVASISAWWLSALSPRSRGSGGMWR